MCHGSPPGYRASRSVLELENEMNKPIIALAMGDPAAIKRGVASKEGGASALANYRHALRMVADGKADAVCFTPFNKQAMRLAHPSYEDEIGRASCRERV